MTGTQPAMGLFRRISVFRGSKFLPTLAATAGAVLVAYGGYGAGVVLTEGANLTHWLQVAGLLLAGCACLAAGQWLRRGSGARETAVTFAAELAALEQLVPVVRTHPDGLTALQDLMEVVFEARVALSGARKAETLVERRPQGGRNHA